MADAEPEVIWTVTLELACDIGTIAFMSIVAEPPLEVDTLAFAEDLINFAFLFGLTWLLDVLILISELLFLLLATTCALVELCCVLDMTTMAFGGAAAVELDGGSADAGGALLVEPFFLLHDVLLWPIPLQILHLIMVPTLDSLVCLGFSADSLFLSFFGLPGILTYPGANGLGLSDTGQLCMPSTG